MVKSIINVRRSSICWRSQRELVTDVRKAKSWLWRHWATVTNYSDPASQTCHAKPKTQINGRRTLPTSFFRWWDAYRKQLGLKTSSPKVRTLWYGRLRSVARFYDWSYWYPSGNRPLRQYLGFTAGAGAQVSSSIRLTAWLQNSKKRAERSERLMYEQKSPRLSPLWLSASSSACHGLLIITVITPLPTKPSATKMPENWSWRTRQLLTCRCISVMLLRSMQNTRRVSWC